MAARGDNNIEDTNSEIGIFVNEGKAWLAYEITLKLLKACDLELAKNGYKY